jgi:hypothetical protein
MKCGLPDGVLYDAVLVGHDKVGDVALVKLYPKKEGQKFPFAPLGDSDKTKAGEWSLAMGNPFMLATDFTPTVTYGLISGVHRYQYPAGVLLEYTDCIQIDTSINPGNSGGPLFNMNAELVGINGRGSFDKRTRINSGVGYAISINQIKNFMGHLRAGLDVDHASLGAVVESESDDGANPRMTIRAILESADAARRGLETGDELVYFAGRPITTVNQFKNVLGLFPRGWRVPMTYRRSDSRTEMLVRLMGVQRQELTDDMNPMPKPNPMPQPRPMQPTKPSPVAKYFQAKTGFANFYFNKQEKDRLWAAFQKHGDLSGFKGEWTVKAVGEADKRTTKLEVSIKDVGDKTPCTMNILGLDYSLEPLETGTKAARDAHLNPPRSGGFLMALYMYRQLMAFGEPGFKGGDFFHGGHEPFYLPPPRVGKINYNALRVDCEVLRTRFAGVTCKWYFALKDQRLVGYEMLHGDGVDEDPCEVYFPEYREVGGKKVPSKIIVRYGNDEYAEFNNIEWGLAAK